MYYTEYMFICCIDGGFHGWVNFSCSTFGQYSPTQRTCGGPISFQTVPNIPGPTDVHLGLSRSAPLVVVLHGVFAKSAFVDNDDDHNDDSLTGQSMLQCNCVKKYIQIGSEHSCFDTGASRIVFALNRLLISYS